MTNDPIRERAIFDQAITIKSPVERSGFIRGACGNDRDQIERIRALIKAHEEEDEFLPTSPGDDEIWAEPDGVISEGPGTEIGHYKLLQKVGEGGMGVVYMAEQTEPVTRKVALKIIKLGMDTKQVVARFEAERQALAIMYHPNIAKVLDAGATETGRPYFVMELVRGVPITEYCDKNKLNTKERLELFIPVCQAIQHAHQKGIIHRDIKPSNVMVTLNEGVPHPMVIDFGIAKATNQKLTEKTLFTNYAQMIGTPAYMAPEQAEMSKLDVDTRTDVYSLGVLLYELLTGTTPFPSRELMSMGYGEMQRIIAEKEPPKPSTRMSTMQNEERTVVASNRGMEVSAVGRAFQGDLDWIVMKALEKDRTHRYETVNEFASDIRRHLSDEPVSAAAPSFAYKLKKFARRNKQHTRALVGIAGALVIGVSVALLALIQKHEADQRIIETKQRELDQSVRADTMTAFIQGLLGKIVPTLVKQGNIKGARELMQLADDVASTSFSNAPGGEIRLRKALITNYGTDMSDTSAALQQAEKIEELLLTAADDQLYAPRAFYRLHIAERKLWHTRSGTEAEKRAMSGLNDLHDEFMQRSTPAKFLAMGCRAVQGTYYLVYRDWENSESAFAEAYELMPREWDSKRFDDQWKYRLPAFYVLTLLAREQKFDLAETILSENSGISPGESDVARDGYIQLIRAWSHTLCAQDRWDEAIEMFGQQIRLMKQAGATESELVDLDAWQASVFARAGQPKKALPLFEAVVASEHSDIEHWRDAVTLATVSGDREARRRLSRMGIERYLSSVRGRSATWVSNTLLLQPAEEIPFWQIRVIIERLQDGSDWTPWSAHYSNGLLALREHRFADGASHMDDHMNLLRGGGVPFTSAESKAQREFIRALLYIQCNRTDEARKSYAEALALLEEADAVTPGRDLGYQWSQYYSAVVFRRETEEVFRRKGITQIDDLDESSVASPNFVE